MRGRTSVKTLKKRSGYDPDPPRCENCINYRKGGFWLKDSLPRTSPPMCKVGEFYVNPIACCDLWTSGDGTPLE